MERMTALMVSEDRDMEAAVMLADDIRALGRVDSHFRAKFQREQAVANKDARVER